MVRLALSRSAITLARCAYVFTNIVTSIHRCAVIGLGAYSGLELAIITCFTAVEGISDEVYMQRPNLPSLCPSSNDFTLLYNIP